MSDRKPGSSREAFELAVRYLQSGDAVAAERVCRDALARDAGDANLLSLLGAALTQQGRPDDALAILGRALELAPGLVAAHESLGNAWLAKGFPAKAIAELERARQLAPARASVLHRLGTVLSATGDEHAAARILGELARQHPGDAAALYPLAGVLCRLNRFAEAEELLARVVTLAPRFADAWIDLGVVQQRRDNLAAAIDSLQQATKLEPGRVEAWTALGTTLAVAGKNDEAIQTLEQALQVDANHADALASLGHVLKTVGEHEKAVSAYRRCIAANPSDGEAYWALADFKTFRFTDAELEAMRSRLASGSLDDRQQVGMLFALGTALDHRADFDAAFECFRQGNAQHRRQQHYDPHQTRQLHDRLIEVFSREFLDKNRGAGNLDPAPIFIVGLPRSGSTLVEQVLASHRDVDGTYELPELGQIARSTATGMKGDPTYPDTIRDLSLAQFQELGTRYLERTRPYRGEAPRFTDKMPNNFVHVGLLALILPNARIINVQRHPLDSCLGSYRQLFASGQSFTYDLRELGEYYLQYERLMGQWRQVLPGQVLDLQYESLVVDFEPQLRRLLDFCGLPWDEACLRFHENRRAVRSASSEQVRQPLNRSGLHRWRNYERHLGPLIEILGPVLSRLPADWQPGSAEGDPG